MSVGGDELDDVGERTLAGLVARADPEPVLRVLTKLVNLVRHTGAGVDLLKPLKNKTVKVSLR